MVTRLWVLSDLHLESRAMEPTAIPDADVCVVAGDVAGRPRAAVRWLSLHVGHRMPIVYVPGNHEFWGAGSMEHASLGGLLASRRGGRVHMLEDDLRVIAGVRFVGATLWTDYALYAPPHEGKNRDEAVAWAIRWAEGTSPDAMNGLKPLDLRARHKRSRAFIAAALATPHDGPTVVVTHHAPHPESVPERFRWQVNSSAYASDLTSVIEAGRPDLWVHGHMHDGCDYLAGDTRVLCNPRGFPGENPDFDPGLVVEVE
ncbi:MAG: metallophosphoesterase [Ancylobacter novellus]|uniref:Metallophosphoesterase n=1 Tax=Ancylobacter novellus TaxID=921 RepID=A0A2W5MLW4_ANCNO|nr:MAG: metallophosphoesterase [Ancylobacter novellus]